jgi:hypothetical protein
MKRKLGLVVLLPSCALVAGLDQPRFVDEALVDAGGVRDTAPPPVDEAAAPDAPTTKPIGPKCGEVTCTGATPRCCFTSPPSCIAADAPCTIPIECDGPEDCPNRVCCIKSGPFSGDTGAQCIERTAPCLGAFGSGPACHDETECEAGKTCEPIALANPIQKSEYRVCQ